MRYTYSEHRTRRAAETALEHYFACGEVSCGEKPEIIRDENGRYAVTLLAAI
jgi:hypothetical protein